MQNFIFLRFTTDEIYIFEFYARNYKSLSSHNPHSNEIIKTNKRPSFSTNSRDLLPRSQHVIPRRIRLNFKIVNKLLEKHIQLF